MKALLLLALLAALAPAASTKSPQDRLWLLSVEGIALSPDEFVDGFTVSTWAVEPVAVCRLPPGWTIRAGKMASPDGVIAGEASHGVTFLNERRLDRLHGLVLVRMPEGAEGRERLSDDARQPPFFTGRAEIGTYGHDETLRRTAPIVRANIRLDPANRCP